MAVPESSIFESLRERVAWPQANPGKRNDGSMGIGTLVYLGTPLFAKATGIEVAHIPFKRRKDAMTALVRGELDFVPAVYPQAQPFAE